MTGQLTAIVMHKVSMHVGTPRSEMNPDTLGHHTHRYSACGVSFKDGTVQGQGWIRAIHGWPGNPVMDRYAPLGCPNANPRLARDTYVRSWFEKMPYMIDIDM
jgi:hypothetical protein